MSISALALDFGGTLARPGPRPDGRRVAAALRTMPAAAIPDRFPAVFDAEARRIDREDRARGGQTPFTEHLAASAAACGAEIPDLHGAVEFVFTAVPDAEVDPRAAAALRALHRRGLRCVLACNTQRPESVRRRTLHTAGIAACLDALVLSSSIGIRKPDPRFYTAVTVTAGYRPQEILFVGDTLAKDALGPHAHGMRAVLIAPSRPADLPAPIGVISHAAELPAYLESIHTL